MSPFRPETDVAALARHAIGDAAERGRLLASLAEQGEVIALYPAGAADAFVVSRALGCDAAHGRLELEFTADAARESTFARAGRATAVALLARVKLQFELDRLRIDGTTRRLLAEARGPFARLQRRDAFRVVPPPDAQARLAVSEGSAEHRVVVLDVSATGIAFRFDAPPSPLPKLGQVWSGCRLELPATAAIRCALQVRSVDPMVTEDHAPQVRIGCEFAGLEPSAARAVQVYVNAAQTRRRRLRPSLG